MANMPTGRLFTFRSGGWVLTVALVVSIAGTAWNLSPLWRRGRERPRGDGRTAASYGFDLADALVPKDRIVSSGMVADALPSIENPKTISFEELRASPDAGRQKLLVSSDEVIGVDLGGESRAYPLRMLAWHEIVNDTLGGVPIAVTYNPISGGMAVFDRRVRGTARTFGVSGLLYQSNLLLYDRCPGHAGESLWSQLQARAVTGPEAAAASELALVPFALCRFAGWAAAYPGSTVLAPIEGETARYNSDPYASYLHSDALRFPVDPLPPAGTFPLKQPVFASPAGGRWTVTPLPRDDGGTRFESVGPLGTTPALGMVAYWFAWYATHPDGAGEAVVGR